MKIDAKYLSGEALEPCWTEPFSTEDGGPFDGLALLVRPPRVSKWREAFLTSDGEPRKVTQEEALARYISCVEGWNVDDEGFDAEKLRNLIDSCVELEGWLVREVEAVRNFRRQPGPAPA